MIDNLKRKINQSHSLGTLESVYSIGKKAWSSAYTQLRYSWKYDSKISPFQIIWVDPNNIKKRQLPHPRINNVAYTISAVESGQWDKRTEPIEKYDLYRSFKNHFIKEYEWEDTDWYNRILNNIKEGDVWYNCSTEEEFKWRCSHIDDLYTSIKKKGYLKQSDILEKNKGTHKWAKYCPELHEVTVNIDRNGDFIFQEGRHRFSIARLLDLEEIPVRVNIRHAYWQQLRDKKIKRDSSKCRHTLNTHPDLSTN